MRGLTIVPKHGIHGLAVALMVTLSASRPLDLRAQEEHPLDKTVTVKADHERLEDVLNDLEKKGYFTFSYKSDILTKDRVVTLTLKESTLREALEQLLGKAYDYMESDDYVIIRPKSRGMARKEFRGDSGDRPYVKIMARTEVTPAMKMEEGARMMKMKEGARMMKRDRVFVSDSVNIDKLRQTVRDIVNEMIADGIIKDKDSFTWFGLDNGQFIVDGKQMADSLRVKYASKYIKADGNGYYCGSVAGITGRGYFFDKKEIFGKAKE